MAAIQDPKEFNFSCEKIAYWFFRLNGCLNLTNFLIHHEKKGREGTEIDVLGVRFPYRRELALSGEAMPDHEIFENRVKKLDIVIADAKRGLSSLNKSWLLPELENIERILLVLGVFHTNVIKEISKELYKQQYYEDDDIRVNFYALGSQSNPDLPQVIIQLTWEDALLFINNRFVTFEDYKRQHDQWDDTGKALYKLSSRIGRYPDRFLELVTKNLSP